MSGSSPLHLRLFDYASSLEVDKRTQARGFSETQLMGQAALASALRLLDRLDQNATDISLPTLWILCGTGNNGGDGLALAYMLLGSGRVRSEQLQIFQTGLMRSQAAKFYLEQLGTAGVTTQPSQAFLGSLPRDHDIIVEALLGTGQSGALRGEVVRLVSEIAHAASKSRAYHVALDVPAGLTEDRRSDMGENEKSSGAVHIPIPDEIHSYGTRKLAAYLDERIVSTSQIIEFPIGFHPEDLGHPVSA
ncbi:MAG: NAD(P)H-hydrate epimerase, partial [Spirochaetia bacterium]|nr:NAD(P)H-hydrate epimerase [Spirochaetia bacterium]